MRPVRRRRGDLVAAAVLISVLALAGAALWRTSPVANTSSVTAVTPLAAPAEASMLPTGFAPAWRAPSAATSAPLVAGPAVVTADGSTVVGRDGTSGEQRWSYTRDIPLCTAAGGFPAADGGIGRVLALYRNRDYCSELTALRPDTGARAGARNPDARPGTRLLATDDLVALTGTEHTEILRAGDLVRTLEFGEVPTPAQPHQQPRTGCRFGSFAFAAERLGVVERCPGEPNDRLTVLDADGPDGAEKPTEQFSVPLPGSGGVLVALSAQRAAVAMPGPPRLLILDAAGAQTALPPLDLPGADVAADPPGGVVPAVADGQHRYWWTGSRTIALDADGLTPLWVLPGTLGPGTRYAGVLLVPVPQALLVVDPADGRVTRTLPVERADRAAPVELAVHGEMLLEQRGGELVALRPIG